MLTMRIAPLLLCLWAAPVTARVDVTLHKFDNTEAAPVPGFKRESSRYSAAFLGHAQTLSTAAKQDQADDHVPFRSSLSESLAPSVKSNCGLLLCILCILCCFGGLLKEAFGEGPGGLFYFLILVSILYYVVSSGIWHAFIHDEPIGVQCIVLGLWASLFLCLLSCYCCMFICAGGALFVIKNEGVKQMHQQYEENKQKLSTPRQEFYEGPVFKKRCDKLFDKYDKDRSGELDMSELLPIVEKELGVSAQQDPVAGHMVTAILKESFSNGSRVHKDEFVHMMQFLSMVKFKEGQVDEEAAYEILQLDPDTATYEEFKRAYKLMALRYHPDKRKDAPEDVVKRDMAEINDAKTALEAKFANNQPQQ